jgi:hypothetical protein
LGVGTSGLNDLSRDIVVTGGNIYFAGSAESSNLPTANAYDSTFNGGDNDGFIVKLAEGGTPPATRRRVQVISQ